MLHVNVEASLKGHHLSLAGANDSEGGGGGGGHGKGGRRTCGCPSVRARRTRVLYNVTQNNSGVEDLQHLSDFRKTWQEQT